MKDRSSKGAGLGCSVIGVRRDWICNVRRQDLNDSSQSPDESMIMVFCVDVVGEGLG